MIPRNSHDSRGAKELGEIGETLFEHEAIKRGYTVSPSSSYIDNAVKHIDFTLSNKYITYTVEVKGPKKINSNDQKINDSLICIEIMGITGKAGWLYGEADKIAFYIKEGFCLVDRKELIDYMTNNFDLSQDPKESPRFKSPHIIYRRSQYGRLDKFMYITKKELLTIKGTEIWRKNV